MILAGCFTSCVQIGTTSDAWWFVWRSIAAFLAFSLASRMLASTRLLSPFLSFTANQPRSGTLQEFPPYPHMRAQGRRVRRRQLQSAGLRIWLRGTSAGQQELCAWQGGHSGERLPTPMSQPRHWLAGCPAHPCQLSRLCGCPSSPAPLFNRRQG